jgi:hypothetical protein
MSETAEMVTLNDGKSALQTAPDTELSIHEAAQWSGYNPLSLRRLDKARKPGFPPAHYKVGGTARFWYAREIEEIVAYKIKAGEDHRKHTSTIYKLANAKRKRAKADKKVSDKLAKVSA